MRWPFNSFCWSHFAGACTLYPSFPYHWSCLHGLSPAESAALSTTRSHFSECQGLAQRISVILLLKWRLFLISHTLFVWSLALLLNYEFFLSSPHWVIQLPLFSTYVPWPPIWVTAHYQQILWGPWTCSSYPRATSLSLHPFAASSCLAASVQSSTPQPSPSDPARCAANSSAAGWGGTVAVPSHKFRYGSYLAPVGRWWSGSFACHSRSLAVHVTWWSSLVSHRTKVFPFKVRWWYLLSADSTNWLTDPKRYWLTPVPDFLSTIFRLNH